MASLLKLNEESVEYEDDVESVEYEELTADDDDAAVGKNVEVLELWSL